MTLQDTAWLTLLLFAPMALLLAIWRGRPRRYDAPSLELFETLRSQRPERVQPRHFAWRWSAVAATLAAVCLALAAARPLLTDVSPNPAIAPIVIDVSPSMSASDSAGVSRLARAKALVKSLESQGLIPRLFAFDGTSSQAVDDRESLRARFPVLPDDAEPLVTLFQAPGASSQGFRRLIVIGDHPLTLRENLAIDLFLLGGELRNAWIETAELRPVDPRSRDGSRFEIFARVAWLGDAKPHTLRLTRFPGGLSSPPIPLDGVLDHGDEPDAWWGRWEVSLDEKVRAVELRLSPEDSLHFDDARFLARPMPRPVLVSDQAPSWLLRAVEFFPVKAATVKSHEEGRPDRMMVRVQARKPGERETELRLGFPSNWPTQHIAGHHGSPFLNPRFVGEGRLLEADVDAQTLAQAFSYSAQPPEDTREVFPLIVGDLDAQVRVLAARQRRPDGSERIFLGLDRLREDAGGNLALGVFLAKLLGGLLGFDPTGDPRGFSDGAAGAGFDQRWQPLALADSRMERSPGLYRDPDGEFHAWNPRDFRESRQRGSTAAPTTLSKASFARAAEPFTLTPVLLGAALGFFTLWAWLRLRGAEERRG